MMTFPAAAAAFSQAQLLAVAQQHRSDAETAVTPEALNRYLASSGLLSASGQFPFNTGVQPNVEALGSMMPGVPNGSNLPMQLMHQASVLRQLQDFSAAQAASVVGSQGLSAGGAGPFPGIVYDPSTIAYHPYALDTTRRKNATRETTLPLKNWLTDHWKNPYPSKGEKVMLAMVTKMSMTQVSTWFANARRRLKKEKKWTPPNRRVEDGDDDDLDNMNRPSSSNSNVSDDVKDDEPLDTERQLKRYRLLESDDADGDAPVPKKKPIWSIADTIEAAENGKESADSSMADCGPSAAIMKDDSSSDAAAGSLNFPQHMLQFYSNGVSSQQLLAAYQRLMMSSPQASASIPPNFYAFNPMLLAAFNQPGSGIQPTATSASQASKPNEQFPEQSSVSPTSSTASQEQTKLVSSSSDDEKTSMTPTSVASTTTSSSTPQKSPSRSPSPSSAN